MDRSPLVILSLEEWDIRKGKRKTIKGKKKFDLWERESFDLWERKTERKKTEEREEEKDSRIELRNSKGESGYVIYPTCSGRSSKGSIVSEDVVPVKDESIIKIK